MKRTKENKLAYAAGIIDGEGCISIYKKSFRNGKFKGTDARNYHLTVVVTQKDGKMMDWLYGNFGGSISLHKKWDRPEQKCWAHEWTLNYQKAADFLKQILPYIVAKKRQAEIAIQFQSRITYGKRITQHELDTRTALADELKREKKNYSFSENHNVQRRVKDENAIVQL